MTHRIVRLSLLFFSLLALSASAQEYQDWKFVHPRPQANSIQKIQMISDNVWITAGFNGTFMKTTNAGQSWFFHHKCGVQNSTTLATGSNYGLWFFNETTGFVSGEQGWIAKTTDGGQTFTQKATGLIPSGQRVQSIAFADANNGYAVAASPSGSAGSIVKTTDGGETWMQVYATTTDAVLSLAVINPQTVYAGTMGGAFLKSTNGGVIWTTVNGASAVPAYSLAFLDANKGIISGSDGRSKRTTNGGVTWDSLAQLGFDFTLRIKIVSAIEIYGYGHSGMLFKSTDFGTTWTQLPISISGPNTWFLFYGFDVRGSIFTMTGDFGIVARSTDAGQTWTSNNKLLGSQLMFDIVAIPGTKKVITAGRQFTAGTGQILYSTDGGDTWSQRDLIVPFDAQSISMANRNVGYISGTNSVVMKTTDGGENWNQTSMPTGDPVTLYVVDFVNETTGWVFRNYPGSTTTYIWKTTDGGQNWQPQSTGASMGGGIMAADMVDANVGYLALNASNSPIYKTTDGGNTWAAVITPLKGNIRGLKAVDANTVYIGQSSGTTRVARTTDGGVSWTGLTLPLTFDVTSLDFTDINNGILCGNTTTCVLRTNNGGLTWTSDNVHMPTLVRAKMGNGDTAYVLGTYSTIMRHPGLGAPPHTVTVNMPAGWNLVSVPIPQSNMTAASVYPGSNSPAYGYNAGYVIFDTLKLGKGYWMRFPSAVNFNLLGNAAVGFSSPLNAVWNLIGTKDTIVQVSTLTTNPAGIINSAFFGYDNGYQTVTSLVPGKGYWVRASQSGTLLFPGALGTAKENFDQLVPQGGKIMITDAQDNSGKLLFANAEYNMELGILPPKPPAGSFDCRFTDDTYITRTSSASEKVISISSSNYPVTIQAEGLNVVVKDAINGKLINTVLRDGGRISISNPQINLIKIEIGDVAPLSYSVDQNYPNPFNPSTSIHYAVPENVLVSLKVYDVLGNEVSTLVNERQDAGQYSVNFDAKGLSSGVYLYKLTAGNFAKTYKMILQK